MRGSFAAAWGAGIEEGHLGGALLADLVATMLRGYVARSGVRHWLVSEPCARAAAVTCLATLPDLILECSMAVDAVRREQMGHSRAFHYSLNHNRP